GSAPGTYPITAALGSLAAANYAFAFVVGTLTVTPAPLAADGVNLAAAVAAPFDGVVATFANADPFGGPSSYAATIAWRAGTTPAGVPTAAAGGVFAVTGSHTHTAPGTYAVSVQAEHRLGYTTAATAVGTATVSSDAFLPSTDGDDFLIVERTPGG